MDLLILGPYAEPGDDLAQDGPKGAQGAISSQRALLGPCRACGDLQRHGELCLTCEDDPWANGEVAAFEGFCLAWLEGDITSWGEPVWRI